MKTEGNVFDVKENQDRHFQSIDFGMVEQFPKIYIFSIDPEHHLVSKGGYGDFLIPAKPEGERVSPPLVIPGRYPSHMHMGTEVFPVHYEDGLVLARDIVGIDSQDKGLGRNTSNLEWHGVFISMSDKPKPQEIAAAEAKRKQFLERIVSDADRKHMSGKSPEIDAKERQAAHELHLKKIWSEHPTAMDNCPACGSSVVPGVAVCPQCRAILNEEAARRFFPERFPKPEPKLKA